MLIDFAKCARCGKTYDRIRSPVCADCQPDEDQDFEEIRNVLSANPDLKAQEVAEAAGVTVECVLRMLDEGQIVSTSLLDPVTCGRCGAPAISRTTRLCERCLMELNQKVMDSINKMRKELEAQKDVIFLRLSTARARAYKVRETFAAKRRAQPPPMRRVR